MADSEMKDRVRRRLLDSAGPGVFEGPPGERRLRLREAVQKALADEDLLIRRDECAALVRELADEVIGFGPIERLMRDPSVSEVMINSPDRIYVERAGRIEPADLMLESETQIVQIVVRAISPLGLRLDESQPCVEARLADGSRLHAVIPPLSPGGPVVTIRRFAVRPVGLDDLVASGSIGADQAEILGTAVQARRSIVISGGTGSGKTTLLNALSASIPPEERIITIEEAAELRLNHPHVVSLEARPPNVEGQGAVTVRDLLRTALRMRPDRIVIGEVRGAETLDMLQAMNTGHDGSLTTCHANSPASVPVRLESMALMGAVGLDPGSVRRQIAAAVDLLVHTARRPDGTRCVAGIVRVDDAGEGGVRLTPFAGSPDGWMGT